MRFLLLAVTLIFFSCSEQIEKAIIYDCGKKEIEDGLYLKKIMVGSDRIYMLVDANGHLINNSVSTSYTVQRGKSSTVESNSVVNP